MRSAPQCELHWPPSLPYGGVESPFNPAGPTWRATWDPLQPTEVQRTMDPRVVGSHGDEVMVLWRQRGLSPGGEHFDGEVIGIYQLRDELLRAQMFYFDTTAVDRFLRQTIGDASVIRQRVAAWLLTPPNDEMQRTKAARAPNRGLPADRCLADTGSSTDALQQSTRRERA
jgi:hypothetical protein